MSRTFFRAVVLISLTVLHTFANRTETADDPLARDGPIEDDFEQQV